MKRKIKRIILGLTAVLLATSYSSFLLSENFETVKASTRLYGVQQVVEKISEEDPFVILELVPDEALAAFGSYVKGAEPTVDAKLLERFSSSAERRSKVLELFEGLVVVEDSNQTGTAYPMHYNFNTMYQEQMSVPEDLANWEIINFAPTQNEDGSINYHTETRNGYYEEVGEGADYTATKVKEEDSSEGTVSGNEAESGSTASGSVSDNDTEDGNTSGDTASDNDASGDSVSGGDAESAVAYTYTYTPGKGTYKWVDSIASDTRYPVSFEKLYYKITFTSNDWFAKSVFEYDEDYTVGNIKVISITPNELETNIAKGYLAEYEGKKIQGWNGVDLLYISNSTCMNLAPEEKILFDAYTESVVNEKDSIVTYTNDISAQTAYNIYEYVLNTSIPVIVDSSIVSEVVASATPTLDTNLQKLAFLLWDQNQ